MDATLVLAVDGVRSLQSVSQSLLRSPACSRAAFLLAADVDIMCTDLLHGGVLPTSTVLPLSRPRPAAFFSPTSTPSTQLEPRSLLPWPCSSSYSGIPPLTDLIAVPVGTPLPTSTHTLLPSSDLNCNGLNLNLAISRSENLNPITGVAAIDTGKGEVLPPGWSPVRTTSTGAPLYLNPGIVLVVCRGVGSPILDLNCWWPNARPTSTPRLGLYGLAAELELQRSSNSSSLFSALRVNLKRDDLPPGATPLLSTSTADPVSITSSRGAVGVLSTCRDVSHLDLISDRPEGQSGRWMDAEPTSTSTAAAAVQVDDETGAFRAALACYSYEGGSSPVIPVRVARQRWKRLHPHAAPSTVQVHATPTSTAPSASTSTAIGTTPTLLGKLMRFTPLQFKSASVRALGAMFGSSPTAAAVEVHAVEVEDVHDAVQVEEEEEEVQVETGTGPTRTRARSEVQVDPPVTPPPAAVQVEAGGEEVGVEVLSLLYRHMSWMTSPVALRACMTVQVEPEDIDWFLSPSAASVALAPLLRTLYYPLHDLNAAALTSLVQVVDAGFFTTSPIDDRAVQVDDLSLEQEAFHVLSSSWSLLDIVTACVCDATSTSLSALDSNCALVCAYLNSVAAAAGARLKPSRRSAATCGLHPATLARILGTAVALHTVQVQKRVYSNRGLAWAVRADSAVQVGEYSARVSSARSNLSVTTSTLASIVAGVTHAGETAHRSWSTTSPVPTDFTPLSSVYHAHASGSGSAAAALHLVLRELEPSFAPRSEPVLPPGYIPACDRFSLYARNAVMDACIALALCARLAAVPSSSSDAYAAPAGAAGGGPDSSKKLALTAMRETGVTLLGEALSHAGRGCARTQAYLQVIDRCVLPALLSHTLTHAYVHPIHRVVDEAGEGGDERNHMFASVCAVLGALLCARGADEAGEDAASSSPATGATGPVNIREACTRSINLTLAAIVLPVLNHPCAPPHMRLECVRALTDWLSAPQMVMEMYLNQDMHPSAAGCYPHTRMLRGMFTSLASAVCKPYSCSRSGEGEAAPLVIHDLEAIVHPDSLPASATPAEKAHAWRVYSYEDYRSACSGLITSIVRCVMDAAATVQLHAAAEEYVATKAGSAVVPPTPDVTHPTSPRGFGGAAPVTMSVRALYTAQCEAEAVYEASLPVFKEKGVRKGLAMLTAAGYLPHTGSAIAHFLRMCGPVVAAPAEIGDYLGDEGRGEEEKALMLAVRHEYFSAMSFNGMTFDVALRVMLTKGGFRLPGEAQKINRVAHAFAVAFYEDNKPSDAMLETAGSVPPSEEGVPPKPETAADGSVKPPVSIALGDGRLFPTSPDVVEILTFSCIMLNTDAHNPSIKKEKKMTQKQFINNNRGIDHDRDIAAPFLIHLYDAITKNEIKMEIPTAASMMAASAAAAAAPAAAATVPGASPVATVLSTVPLLPGEVRMDDVEASSSDPMASFMKYQSEASYRCLQLLAAHAKANDGRAQALARGDTVAAASYAPVYSHVPYRRTFSTTTVTCLLEDLWPAIMRIMTIVLRIQPPRERRVDASASSTVHKTATSASMGAKRMSLGFGFFSGTAPASASLSSSASVDDVEDAIPIAPLRAASPEETAVRVAALDTLKFAVSASIFLQLHKFTRIGADALLQVEAAALGRDVARKSMSEGWYAGLMAHVNSDPASAAAHNASAVASATAGVVGELHIAVAEMREALTNIADKAVVETTAGKFTGELSRLLSEDPRRKLVYEGDLTKVASGGAGRHTVYRFFLFNDILVYASKPLFSTRYAVHQVIPLRGMRMTENPEELRTAGVASSIKLENDRKNLFLYASEAEMIEWRRHVREAIAAAGPENSASLASTFSRRGSMMPPSAGLNRRESDVHRLPPVAEGGTPASHEGRRSVGLPTRDGSPAEFSAASPAGANVPAAQAASPPPAPMDRTSSPATAAQTFVHADAPSPAAAARPPVHSNGATAGAPGARVMAVSTPPLPNTTVTSSAGVPALVAAVSASGTHDLTTIAGLKNAFLHAVGFCRPLLSSDTAAQASGSRVDGGMASPSIALTLSNADKLAFYAYFKQATHGDCPALTGEDDVSMMVAAHDDAPHAELSAAALAVTKAKRDAWRSCSGMRRRDAMKAFVVLLDKSVPGWDNVVPAPAAAAATSSAAAPAVPQPQAEVLETSA